MPETAIAASNQQIMPYASKDNFIIAMQMAKELSNSTLIPDDFRGDRGRANCLIAIEIAARMGISPFMCMQNINVIHGKPSFSASFLIGMINASGRFNPLKFRFEKKDGGTCVAYTEDKRTGEPLEGPPVSMRMAEDEGWTKRNGSKWKTMPDLMLRYRAAAFFSRTYCPEMALGLRTEEEVIDIGPDGDNPPAKTARTDSPASGKAERIASDILGAEEPVIDAKLRADTGPSAPVDTPPPDEPPAASQSECGKVWRAYTAIFHDDKNAAKAEVDRITGGKPSKYWSVPDVEALYKRLAEIERDRPGISDESQDGLDEEAPAEQGGGRPAGEKGDITDAGFEAAEAEAAAFL